MLVKKLFVIVPFLLSAIYALDVNKTGTTAAKFLSIGAGSRAVAMGGAFVSIANDATAMYWNVGGLPQLQKTELLVNYSKWIADIGFTYMGLAIPIDKIGVVGLNVTAMTMNEMEITTYGAENGTGETFKAGSYAVGFSYARQLTDRFSIGANFKYINEFISQSSANGFAMDIGTLFVTPFKGVRFGASISNFGQKLQMTGDDLLVQKDIDESQHGNNKSVNAVLSTDKFDLPLLLRVGISKDIISTDAMHLIVAIDGMHPNDNVEYINSGFEFSLLRGLVFLRGGIKSLFIDRRSREEEGEEEFTIGGGFNTKLGNGAYLSVDYAFESFVHLKEIHKFTIQLMF